MAGRQPHRSETMWGILIVPTDSDTLDEIESIKGRGEHHLDTLLHQARLCTIAAVGDPV